MIAACKIDISVGEDDFDSAVELEKLRSAGVGAIASFTGIVRDEATGPALIALTLEHYPEMTTSQLSNWPEWTCSQLEAFILIGLKFALVYCVSL